MARSSPSNTTLTADIGPCRRGGLTIGASNITLDLGGHTVSGIDRTGDGAGIRFKEVTGSTVINGTVRAFDIGVLVAGGGDNTVASVLAQDNVGTHGLSAGDGISIQASSNNRVTDNTVSGNGPFAGISIVNDAADSTQMADGNEISGNVVSNNNNQRRGGRCRLHRHREQPGHQQRGERDPHRVARQHHHVEHGDSQRGCHRDAFDLLDAWPECDNNTWTGNTFGTRRQACIN